MKTGGDARYFFCVRNTEEVKKAMLFAKARSVPIFILGGGSNVIISDDGFSGVVIKMEIGGIKFKEISNNKIRITAGAGVGWDEFVKETVDMKLYGIENLSSIPGTVGASPVQNIGAYGMEVKDVISWVEVLNTSTMTIMKIMNKECLFGYRDSLFKKAGKKFIILNVVFDLEKIGKLKTEYVDIQRYFLELSVKKKITPTLNTLRSAIIEIRESKLPNIKDVGTVGSFFKNPVIIGLKFKELLKTYPDIKYFFIDGDFVKLSAAWLLDNIGNWNSVCKGDVCVCKNHSLILINKGDATTREILNFAKEMQNDIKTKTGVVLEFEVNII